MKPPAAAAKLAEKKDEIHVKMNILKLMVMAYGAAR